MNDDVMMTDNCSIQALHEKKTRKTAIEYYVLCGSSSVYEEYSVCVCVNIVRRMCVYNNLPAATTAERAVRRGGASRERGTRSPLASGRPLSRARYKYAVENLIDFLCRKSNGSSPAVLAGLNA